MADNKKCINFVAALEPIPWGLKCRRPLFSLGNSSETSDPVRSAISSDMRSLFHGSIISSFFSFLLLVLIFM